MKQVRLGGAEAKRAVQETRNYFALLAPPAAATRDHELAVDAVACNRSMAEQASELLRGGGGGSSSCSVGSGGGRAACFSLCTRVCVFFELVAGWQMIKRCSCCNVTKESS